MKPPLLIIFCVALSIGVKAQGKHIFNADTMVNALQVTMPDTTITIVGDTTIVLKLVVRQYLDVQDKLTAARELLNSMGTIYYGQARDSKAYKTALANYWKLNNDSRYKHVGKYITPPKVKYGLPKSLLKELKLTDYSKQKP